MTRLVLPLVLSILGVAAAAATRNAAAQAPSSTAGMRSAPPFVCDGRRITSVTIVPGRPPFEGSAKRWQTVARAFGLHHATTRADVIRTYLLLREGGLCSERRRAESERVLRALPFLADASVRTLPDSAGGVQVEVSTTDEIPVLVSGGLRRGVPAALSLGNENVSGLGLRVIAGAERGFAYRNGAHAQVIDYAPFDQAAVVGIDAAYDPLGSHIELGASHLFLSDLQRGSWQASYRMADEFPELVRPLGDATSLREAVEVREEQWALSGVLRSEIDGTVLLFGGVTLGNKVSPRAGAVFVTDSGLVAANDTALRNRYTAFHSARVGGLLGVRRVRYKTVNGLDALFAPQDIMTGLQIGGLAAPGITSGTASRAGHDLFFASSAAAGGMVGRLAALADVETEIRRDFDTGDWDSMVGNGHASFYDRLGFGQLLRVDDQLSMISHARLPTQLTFHDPFGGLLGYGGSTLAGARRNVAHIEYRWARPAVIHQADAGFALFSEIGTLWAGDAPYGVTTTRESIGISLLASYPTRSKNLYRIDLAVPLQRYGGRGLEVRFTAGNPTSLFSREPNDVMNARLGPEPSTLFAWPQR